MAKSEHGFASKLGSILSLELDGADVKLVTDTNVLLEYRISLGKLRTDRQEAHVFNLLKFRLGDVIQGPEYPSYAIRSVVCGIRCYQQSSNNAVTGVAKLALMDLKKFASTMGVCLNDVEHVIDVKKSIGLDSLACAIRSVTEDQKRMTGVLVCWKMLNIIGE